MLHPVGPQNPSVYWRRRLVLLGSIIAVVVLIALTVKALGSSNGSPQANGSPPTTTPPTTAVPTTPHTAASSSANSPAKSPASTPVKSSGSATGSKTSKPAAPTACRSSNLDVVAVTGKTGYKVGDKPLLQLQVTNKGSAACIQNLADKEVELRVYNGESRVWGSHDCQVQPGSNDRTLAPNAPVRVAISWSGLTSQPKCAGTRQRVGAGTYTLYAVLAGKTGKATQFSIS